MILQRCRPDNYRDEVPLQKLILVIKRLLMHTCLHKDKYVCRSLFLELQRQQVKK